MLAAQYLVNTIYPTVFSPLHDHNGVKIQTRKAEESQVRTDVHEEKQQSINPLLEHIEDLTHIKSLIFQLLNESRYKQAVDLAAMVEKQGVLTPSDDVKKLLMTHVKAVSSTAQKITLPPAQVDYGESKLEEELKTLREKSKADIKSLDALKAHSASLESQLSKLSFNMAKEKENHHRAIEEIQQLKAQLKSQLEAKIATQSTPKEAHLDQSKSTQPAERIMNPSDVLFEREKGVPGLPYKVRTDATDRKLVKQKIIRKVKLLLPPEERDDKDLLRMVRYQLLTSMSNAIAMTLHVHSSIGNTLSLIENEFF